MQVLDEIDIHAEISGCLRFVQAEGLNAPEGVSG